MPQTQVEFYCDPNGCSPVLDWLEKLQQRHPRAAAKIVGLIEQLEATGHELRRPQMAPLRDGIYELRARVGGVNYRLLFFFHGRNVAIVAHGLTKERTVPKADIERAIERKQRHERAPEQHQRQARGQER